MTKAQNMRHGSPDGFTRYLPIDDELFCGPLYLTGVGRAVIPAGAAYPPSGHPDLYQFDWHDGRVLPEFSLLWIEEGEGIWQTREGTYPIRAGQVGRVLSGQWHRYRPNPKTGWIENWIQYNGRMAHELHECGVFSSKDPICSSGHPDRFARLMREFLSDASQPEFVNNIHQGLRLIGLLGLLETSVREKREPATDLVEGARRHIWSHSHRQLNVSEVAHHLGVSRRTLERAFSNSGLPGVLDEINRCRLNRAERLLLETRLPIKHVVSLSGFGTPEQMRIQFQLRHGISPGEYRKITGLRSAGIADRE